VPTSRARHGARDRLSCRADLADPKGLGPLGRVCRVFSGPPWAFSGFPGPPWASPDLAYKPFLGSPGPPWAFPGLLGPPRAFPGPPWAFPGFPGLLPGPPRAFPGPPWAFPGFLGSPGPLWATKRKKQKRPCNSAKLHAITRKLHAPTWGEKVVFVRSIRNYTQLHAVFGPPNYTRITRTILAVFAPKCPQGTRFAPEMPPRPSELHANRTKALDGPRP
jgi:hypothetical protein